MESRQIVYPAQLCQAFKKNKKHDKKQEAVLAVKCCSEEERIGGIFLKANLYNASNPLKKNRPIKTKCDKLDGLKHLQWLMKLWFCGNETNARVCLRREKMKRNLFP